jgi:hypothetical protein
MTDITILIEAYGKRAYGDDSKLTMKSTHQPKPTEVNQPVISGGWDNEYNTNFLCWTTKKKKKKDKRGGQYGTEFRIPSS